MKYAWCGLALLAIWAVTLDATTTGVCLNTANPSSIYYTTGSVSGSSDFNDLDCVILNATSPSGAITHMSWLSPTHTAIAIPSNLVTPPTTTSLCQALGYDAVWDSGITPEWGTHLQTTTLITEAGEWYFTIPATGSCGPFTEVYDLGELNISGTPTKYAVSGCPLYQANCTSNYYNVETPDRLSSMTNAERMEFASSIVDTTNTPQFLSTSIGPAPVTTMTSLATPGSEIPSYDGNAGAPVSRAGGRASDISVADWGSTTTKGVITSYEPTVANFAALQCPDISLSGFTYDSLFQVDRMMNNGILTNHETFAFDLVATGLSALEVAEIVVYICNGSVQEQVTSVGGSIVTTGTNIFRIRAPHTSVFSTLLRKTRTTPNFAPFGTDYSDGDHPNWWFYVLLAILLPLLALLICCALLRCGLKPTMFKDLYTTEPPMTQRVYPDRYTQVPVEYPHKEVKMDYPTREIDLQLPPPNSPFSEVSSVPAYPTSGYHVPSGYHYP